MYELGQVLTMKKPHPCGGRSWTVTRVGADVKIQCNTCNRFVNLTRDELKKRVKSERPAQAKKEEE
ncbi:MAG: DUF951 domain-containing protein [Clostridia bacterium]|nr:DUF951 domain-containing protein [Clostridia bacterium]